ncbi:MAG: hypothetical protein ACREJO_02220 [Phycisphaerales bacterium]
MTLAAALGAMLLTAMGSVVLMASKALPDQSTRKAFVDQMSALNRLTTDVTYATAVTSISATSIVVTVPDRDNDGRPESITYSWSGVRGDPLMRRYNDATPEALAADVATMTIAAATQQYQKPTTYTAGATSVLASCTGSLLVSRTTIDSLTWAGQITPVTLPSGATKFTVTKVELMGRIAVTVDGVTSVQLRGTRSGVPNSTVLAYTDLPETSLGASDGWETVSFASPPTFAAGTSVCLLAQWKSGIQSGAFRQDGGLLTATGGTMMTTSDGGATWSSNTNKSLFYKIWGQAYTPDPVAYETRVSSVTVTVRGTVNTAERSVVIPLANQPVSP